MPLPAIIPGLVSAGRTLLAGANSPAGQILQTGIGPIVNQLFGGQQQQQQPKA